jgi:uncharacterized membrane-anchored protein YhcB (DUF1043 family)
MTDKCFVRITNQDVFKEVKALRADLDTFKSDIKSKIKVSQWCSVTAMTLVVGLIIGMVLK